MTELSSNPTPATESARVASAEVPQPRTIAAKAPPVVLRLLLGFAGLALLVGFFLPWVRVPADVQGGISTMRSGLDLMTSGELGGTPSLLLLAVPALGAALSATAFMGFRFSGQFAVGVAALLIAYALYVVIHFFLQRTAPGMWLVAGSTVVILLLGIIAWMLGRHRFDSPVHDSQHTTDVIARAEPSAGHPPRART